ncbi:hypothetical protein RRG08_056479 [Elysia crispata]|uniref:Uncharacterized protein n=1 Tax=Elysia crispata TaxID=231223 RepID=A0AAE0XRS4_9GAST|nr:hypothetical protein RRG08_056479 [Elysia crispata]
MDYGISSVLHARWTVASRVICMLDELRSFTQDVPQVLDTRGKREKNKELIGIRRNILDRSLDRSLIDVQVSERTAAGKQIVTDCDINQSG